MTSNPLDSRRIGIIGAGAMGGALCRGMVKSEAVKPDQIMVYDPIGEKCRELQESLKVHTASDIGNLISTCEILILAVKPHLAVPVLEELSDFLSKKKLIISIAAGVKIESLEKAASNQLPVIRAMPNTPAQISKGACAYCRGSHARDEHAEVARAVFETVGIAVEVDEKLMDAVTGLSGSGPAYIFLVIEALTDGGVKAGLPRDVSLQLAAQTVLGAAQMVMELNLHPAVLKDRVTTPGGTTITGLSVLEETGLRSAFIKAVEAATRRAAELG